MLRYNVNNEERPLQCILDEENPQSKSLNASCVHYVEHNVIVRVLVFDLNSSTDVLL